MTDPMNSLLEAASDIRNHRLDSACIVENFADLHAPLTQAEASIEAGRCYFCFDAPCTTACPTGIDVPAFIQNIHTGNTLGAAKTILSENIMGGMCARVCPTEVLCEEACVRNAQQSKPVEIGRLQRFATDPVLEAQRPLFTRAADSGYRVAIVGAGPAGLSCAHRLAQLGHRVQVFESRDKIAGLNEYGIAAYKANDDIAAQEARYILSIGGIEVKTGVQLGVDFNLAELREKYDAVFLAAGLGDTRRLNIEGEETPGVMDAVEYIASLRQSPDMAKLPVGRRVMVIGGGMTAIDIAIQNKLLGADEVTIVYRRGQAQMPASEHEQALAQTHGVLIRYFAAPQRIVVQDGTLRGVEFARMSLNEAGELQALGERFTLDADAVFKAIGQVMSTPDTDPAENRQMPETRSGKIMVDTERKTSLEDVWAGGDCVFDGENLTVYAVQDGKLAALSIDSYLSEQGKQ